MERRATHIRNTTNKITNKLITVKYAKTATTTESKLTTDTKMESTVTHDANIYGAAKKRYLGITNKVGICAVSVSNSSISFILLIL